MTGIERLREFVSGISTITELSVVTKTSYDREHMEEVGVRLRDFLDDIADQIERELDEDCDRMGLDYGAVSRVVSDMERHLLGHEGMEDSPVARWARELRGALTSNEAEKMKRGHADDVSMSAYDLLSQADHDAIAWVRAHGGLDRVKAEWSSRVPRDLYERRRQRLLGHIAECETALGRRNVRIEKLGRTVEFFQLNNSNFRHLLADVAERLGFTRYGDDYEPEDLLNALDRRLMPEGMEWPRYEGGEPVELGDEVSARTGGTFAIGSITLRDDSFALNASWFDRGERVRRHAVLAADGEPLEVGQTVWGIGRSQHEFEVLALNDVNPEVGNRFNVKCFDRDDNEECWCDPKLLTHTDPKLLTHAKPEPRDSWERVEEDADALVDAEINGDGSYNAANAYCNRRGLGEGTSFVVMAQDLVRRCRALAERESGE